MFDVSKKTQRIKRGKARIALKKFLNAAMHVVRPIDGSAVHWITERISSMAGGVKHANGKTLANLADLMLEPVLATGSQEFRLNKAGFKLFLFFDQDGLTAYIGGDQADNHPDARLILTAILRREGMLEDRSWDGYCIPLCPSWIDRNWNSIHPWAKQWMAENQVLLPKIVRQHLEEIC